jgi:hypothetical protein
MATHVRSTLLAAPTIADVILACFSRKSSNLGTHNLIHTLPSANVNFSVFKGTVATVVIAFAMGASLSPFSRALSS